MRVNSEDDVDLALQAMRDHRIRRLPVVAPDGELEGMLSMNDVVLKANGAAAGSIKYKDVVRTYQAICEHPVPEAASSIAAT